ncbi:MAG: DevR family CRISPR-associated autoregulator [Rubrobacteraceae bacterium]
MDKQISSVSISGRLTLDLHSLNNEGAEGNQLQTRMVHIVDGEGSLQVVNAISGDMFKHIQAEHFQEVAKEAGLPLCAGCQVFDANRINADTAFFDNLTDGNEGTIDQVLGRCAMDDAEGILITQGNRSTPRKSCVEFGWVVGLPQVTRTESYFHVKYDPRERGAGSGSETGANVGQNIFYRPASSGVYAVVTQVEASRVGFNDISREYAVEEDDRKKRIKALMESVTYSFLEPKGAHRNAQNPHILGFEGVVSVSRSSMPAPTASALADGYVEEVEAVAAQLNRLRPDAIQTFRFGSQSEFAQTMTDLIEEAENEAGVPA